MAKTANSDDYVLTQDEYQNLCTMFYQVKSMAATLSIAARNSDREKELDFPVMASSVLSVIDERMTEMEPLLGK